MRRVALLLVLGGALAALALTAASNRLSQANGSTRDVLRVYVDEGDAVGVDFAWTGGSPRALADSFAVFRRSARPSDELPPVLRRVFRPSPHLTPEPDRSRLLVAAGSARMFGFPTKEGSVCYALEPPTAASCTPGLLHGALPQVERGQVLGLLDDGAVSVDVRLPTRWVRATTGRNAFYLRLPPPVRAPTQIVVNERDGVRHVYDIRRCRIGKIVLGGPLVVPPC